MSRWCRDCAVSRLKVLPQLRTCKSFRLCKEVDLSLLHRYPGQALETYRQMAREIEIGYLRSQLLTRAPFPATGSALLEEALRIHRITFQSGDPAIAGLLRTRDVYFGSGENEMKGTAPSAIESGFSRMEVQLPRSGDRSPWAQWGASLLHRFFAIHPFEDGNGRVARRLLEWGLESGGRWELSGYSRTSSRDVRGYVQALEYAHRHAPASGNAKARPFVNHLRFLTHWLEVRLSERNDLEEATEPPPSS